MLTLAIAENGNVVVYAERSTSEDSSLLSLISWEPSELIHVLPIEEELGVDYFPFSNQSISDKGQVAVPHQTDCSSSIPIFSRSRISWIQLLFL